MLTEEEVLKKYYHERAKKGGKAFAEKYKANPAAYPHVKKFQKTGTEALRRYREKKKET